MKFIACAIFDSKAKAFMPPFFQVNEHVARRTFSNIANTAGHQIARNPEDFVMFIIGTFDDESGELRPFPQHINLGLASQYVEQSPTLTLAGFEKEKQNVDVR